MMGFLRYKEVILGVLTLVGVLVLYMYIGSLKTQIKELRNEVKELSVDALLNKHQADTCKQQVEVQNSKIEELAAKEKKALMQLEAWKHKPAKVKYKVITKIRKVKSNECKDVKNAINAIRSIDYNDL